MRSRLAAVVALALVVLLGWHGGAMAQGSEARSTVADGDFAGLVTIPAGRRLYLECHGAGSPTVVFEAGLRSRGDIWSGPARASRGAGVLPRVSPLTRACVYDRPGTLARFPDVSRSDPVPMPRSTGEVVADLHALLAAAGIPGPYVIVGASTGGLIAREYASLFPQEVSGLVLVDAISEAMQGLMKPRQFARYNHFYLQSPSPEASRYEYLEAIDYYRSFAEMRSRRRTPPRLRVVVLSAQFGFGRAPGVSRRFARLVNSSWRRSQLYLATLRPRTKLMIAHGSGHQIHVNRPGLVARQALRMVARARGG